MEDFITNYLSPPLILTFLGGLATLFLGIISSLYKKDSQPLMISCGIVFAGILILVGSSWSGINQNKYQRKIIALQTGAGSYAFALLTFANSPESDVLKFNIIHEGKFPIYGLQIKITDEDRLLELFHEAIEKKIPNKLQYIAQATTTIPTIDSFGPVNNIISDVATYNMPANLKQRIFSVKIASRYGRLLQAIHVKRNPNGSLAYDSILRRGDEIIYSAGDPNYFKEQAASKSQTKVTYKKPTKQGEHFTYMVIDGHWYAFDTNGELIEPVNK